MNNEFNVGDKVIYTPFGKNASPDPIQQGIIKEITENGIFVVYNCGASKDWRHYNQYPAEWTAIYCLSKGWKN